MECLWIVSSEFAEDFEVILTANKTRFLVDLDVLLLLCLLKIFTTFPASTSVSVV